MQIYSPIAQDSLVVSGSMNVSGSVTAQSFTGSFSGTASYAANALTSSYALTASVALNVPATASYAVTALTASYANFAVNTTSASFAVSAAFASQAAIASSASFATNAGTAGSASFATNASTAASASHAVSASYATASAFANNSTSASYALSASFAVASSTAVSASFATNAANASSASYALNSSNTVSASFARSASYAMSASYATASSFATTASYALFAATATTASFATNASTAASASFATNAGTAGSASYAVSASYATASSFASSASYALNASNAVTASHALNSVSASYALFAANSTSASYALSASYAFNSSVAISASYATNAGFAGSASFATNASTAASASYATNAGNAGSASFATQAANASSASYALNTSNATSASFATSAANATTASYANFANTASSADNFNVRNTLTATTIVVQTITSSQEFVTGSTKFGSIITNTHQFTGSVSVTGSITVIDGVTNNLTASWANRAISSSYADTATSASRALQANTASYIQNAASASYALSSSYALNTSNAVSASFATQAANATSASFAISAANATTASHAVNAVTASFALNSQNAFVQNGNSFGAQALLGTNDAQNLAFETNGTVRMLISGSNGQVIIGATNSTLTRNASVVGTTGFSVQYDNNSGTYLDIIPNIADSTVDIKASKLTGAFPPMTFHTSGSERMRLTTDGHFILKSMTPGGGTQADFYVVENGGFVIDSSEGATQRYIEFTTGGTTKMLIKADGNVGIGATDPTSKLHILYAGDDNPGIRLQGDGTDNTLEFRTNNNVAHIQAYTGSAFTTGSFLALNASGGNVGINTAAPNAILHIHGTLERRYFNINAIAGFAGIGSGSDAMALMNNTGDGNTLLIRTNNSSRNDAAPLAVWTENNSRFIILNNGSVGIGSATPTAGMRLDVIGKIRATDDLVMAQANPAISFDDGNAGALRFFSVSGSAERMRIQSNGNVGIGTTSPGDLLHIGNITTGGNLRLIASSYGNNGLARFFGTDNGEKLQIGALGSSQAFMFTPASVDLAIYTGNSERMRITSGGNVGINTTAPTDKLHVESGRISVTEGGTYGLSLIASGSGGRGGIIQTKAAIDWNNAIIINSSGNVGIGMGAPAYQLDVLGNLMTNFYSSGNPSVYIYENGAGSNGGTVDLYDRATGTVVTRLAGAPGLNSYFNNSANVGIGTTSPTTLLHIKGLNPILNVETTWASGNYGQIRLGYVAGSNRSITGHYDDGMTFDVNGERMRINPSGYVGINTTAPGSYLEIDDEDGGQQMLRVRNYAVGSTGNFTGHYMVELRSAWTTGAASGSLLVHSQEANDDRAVMAVSDSNGIFTRFVNGKVGIGSTIPETKLDISGATRITNSSGSGNFLRIRSTTANYGGQVDFYENNTLSHAIVSTGANNTFYIRDEYNAATRLLINSAGNVGIGTTSPLGRLYLGTSALNTAGDASDALNIKQTSTTATTGIYLERSGERKGYYIYMSAADDALTFQRNNAGTKSDVMALTREGNVGIGTTSPTRLLDVNGVIRTQNAGSAGAPSIELGTSAQGNGLFYPTTNTIAISTNDTERMRITSGGNVGIGTTSLLNTSNFQMSAGSGASATPYMSIFNTAATPTVNASTRFDLGFLNGASDYVATDTILGYINFMGQANDAGYGGAGIYAQVVSGGNVGRGSGHGVNLIFNTKATDTLGYVERMRITSGGNVGIGTTAPSYKLDVSGSTRIIGGIMTYGSTSLLEIDGTNTSAGASGGSQNWRIGQVANDTLIIQNSGNERLRINSSGNVGIGTTNPDSKLRVEGRIYTTGTAGSANAIFQGGQLEFYKDATPTYAASIGLSGPASGGTNDIVLNTYNGAWSERMRITTGGNVGIGSFSPSATLDVTGSSVDFVIPATATLPGAVPFTINSTGTARSMTGNAGGYSFGDNTMLTLIAGDDVQTHLALWRASNTATGSSGFGGSKLVGYFSRGSMAAPASVGDDDIIFSVEGWAIHGAGPNKGKFGAGMRFVKDDDFGTASTYAPQRTEFYNAVNTTTIQTNMTILPNGNVGIGTDTPNYKLRVQGDIYASADVIAYSDARAKDNVKTVENALAKVTSLRGVTYTRNDIEDKSTKLGVIAQEVLKVLPEVVREGDDGYYSVAYGNIVGVLIEAIKELKAEIDELKNNKQ